MAAGGGIPTPYSAGLGVCLLSMICKVVLYLFCVQAGLFNVGPGSAGIGPNSVSGKVLTPPYFNIAQGRNIQATATCGEGVANSELYCRLTGTTSSLGTSRHELIQGQMCDYCNPGVPGQDHRAAYAIDGTERWWQSPPLSRLGVELNKVNLTVSLGQVSSSTSTVCYTC